MVAGVGVDLVSVSRLSRLLCRVPSLEKKILSPRERDLPVRSKAGNIAAKEAMLKSGLLTSFKSFRDIEICREFGGKPKAKSVNISRIGSITGENIHISISYLNDTALALVVHQEPSHENQKPDGL
jgi:holo-[acyl-carrier protein] synthase